MKINSIDFVKDAIQHGETDCIKILRKNYDQPLITVITIVLNGEKIWIIVLKAYINKIIKT